MHIEYNLHKLIYIIILITKINSGRLHDTDAIPIQMLIGNFSILYNQLSEEFVGVALVMCWAAPTIDRWSRHFT